MFRVRLILATAAIAIAPALAGCSGSSLSTYVPDWLQFKPPPPPTQALQFESVPPGAQVRSAQGQTCPTPCSLAVPGIAQAVTFALNGYVPQTVQVAVSETGDLSPNPVEVALQPVAPPPRAVRKPARKPPPKTAARPAPSQTPNIIAPESTAPPPSSVGDRFPPPTQQSSSPFPPPPPQR
jgi:hypothetical protein